MANVTLPFELENRNYKRTFGVGGATRLPSRDENAGAVRSIQTHLEGDAIMRREAIVLLVCRPSSQGRSAHGMLLNLGLGWARVLPFETHADLRGLPGRSRGGSNGVRLSVARRLSRPPLGRSLRLTFDSLTQN